MPGKTFSEGEQVLILKLVQYFQREKEAGKSLIPLNAVHNRVADALGVSLATIQRLVTNGVRKAHAVEESKLCNKTPQYQVYEHIIRGRIYAMYAAGEHVTLKSLHNHLQNIDQVTIPCSSLALCLKKLKFKWRKCIL